MKDYGNLLRNLRESRDLTQEQAAEAAGISADSWYCYETGRRIPSDDNIPGICDALDAPWLAVCYLEARDPCGTLPPLAARSLARAALSLSVRLTAFTDDCLRTLLEVAEDDRIDADEESAFREIVQQLDQLIEAALAVKFPVDAKKDRPEAVTSGRSARHQHAKLKSTVSIAHSAQSVNTFSQKKKGGSV